MNQEESLGNGAGFHYRREVSFADTDAGGVGHFARLLCILEEAEHVCMRGLGFPMYAPGHSWPRVHVEVDYKSPAYAGDLVDVQAVPSHIGESALTWLFTVTKGDVVVMNASYTVVRMLNGRKNPFTDGERQLLESL